MEDELVGVLGKLVEFVENASPVIWEAAQRQVLVNVVRTSVWAVALALVCGVSIYLARKLYKKSLAEESNKKSSDLRDASIIVSVSAVLLTGAVIALVNNVVGYLLNPTYYAIENILSMVR